MNTDIVARLLCALLTLYPPLSALDMGQSLSARMLMLEHTSGQILFGGMGLIAFLITVDVMVNTGRRIRWRWIAHHRDHLYLGAAFCAAASAFSVSKYARIDLGAGFLYTVIFLGSITLAWCDSYAKRNTIHREDRRAKTI